MRPADRPLLCQAQRVLAQQIIGALVESGDSSRAAFELRSKLQPPLRMAAARCANVLAALAGKIDTGGNGAVDTLAAIAAQFDHADELLFGVVDLDAPLVEATATRRIIQLKAKTTKEPRKHVEGGNTGIVGTGVDPLTGLVLCVAVQEARLTQCDEKIDRGGEPVMPTVRVPSGLLNSLTPLLDAGSPAPASTALTTKPRQESRPFPHRRMRRRGNPP